MTRRELILVTVSDLAGNFAFYDRKEDSELPLGAIDEAIKAGEITLDEIVGHFREKLEKTMTNEVTDDG